MKFLPVFRIGFRNSLTKTVKALTILSLIISALPNKSYAQEPTVGLILNDSMAAEGYTLLMPFGYKKTFLIDNCGLIVHEWDSEMPALVTYLLPDGRLLRGGPHVEILNWNSSKSWVYKIFSPEYSRHHDMEYLPNGNILISIWDILDRDSAVALGIDTTLINPDKQIWDEVIIEVKPTGATTGDIVWEWHASDHSIQDFNSALPNYGKISEHPELININYPQAENGTPDDWLHFNSLDYNHNLNQIMISCHTLSEIYIIDHSTNTNQSSGHIGGNGNKGGDLLYRWGNPEAYDQGDEADKQSSGQHDAQWILSGVHEGEILFFNNRLGTSESSVDIIDPQFNGSFYPTTSDSVYFPESPSLVVRPKDDFASAFMSSCQLFNETHLISCESLTGRVTEYDLEDDRLLWEYVLPITSDSIVSQGSNHGKNWMFRAKKFAPNYSGFTGKTLTATIPLEKNPWDSDCFEVKQDTSTVSINPVVIGPGIKLYPNPAQDVLTMHTDLAINQIVMMDFSGRTVFKISDLNTSEHSISISDLPMGMYIVKLQVNNQWYNQKVTIQH